jgi:hypothetical protein
MSYFKPERCPKCNALPVFKKVYPLHNGKKRMFWLGQCPPFLNCRRRKIVVNHNKGIAIHNWNAEKFFVRYKIKG